MLRNLGFTSGEYKMEATLSFIIECSSEKWIKTIQHTVQTNC